jgi:ribonuclease HI
MWFSRPTEIYTDGSSKNGVSSWAYVISKRGKIVREKSGTARRAGNNAMEFQAVIEALSSVRENSKIVLYSDSKILIDAMIEEKGPAAFRNQIEILLALKAKHKISWRWIKAHNGNEFNERCDRLCAEARNN